MTDELHAATPRSLVERLSDWRETNASDWSTDYADDPDAPPIPTEDDALAMLVFVAIGDYVDDDYLALLDPALDSDAIADRISSWLDRYAGLDHESRPLTPREAASLPPELVDGSRRRRWEPYTR